MQMYKMQFEASFYSISMCVCVLHIIICFILPSFANILYSTVILSVLHALFKAVTSHSVASVASRSKAAVLLLFIYCCSHGL